MKSLLGTLGIVLVLLLVTPATVIGTGEGRYQATTIFRGSTPMVFILDTKTGTRGFGRKAPILTRRAYEKSGLPSIIREEQ